MSTKLLCTVISVSLAFLLCEETFIRPALAEERLQSTDAVAVTIPHCGVASTFASLRALGWKGTLQQVEDCFLALFPGIDLRGISFSHIRSVVESLGFIAEGLRCDTNELIRMEPPVILHIDPSRLPGRHVEMGHFFVYVAEKHGDIEIVDYSLSSDSYFIHAADMSRLWSGMALRISVNRKSYIKVLDIVVFACLLCAFGIAVVAWRRIQKPRRARQVTLSFWASVSCAVSLCAFSGCQRQVPASSPSPVVFEKSLIDLGVVRQKHFDELFNFEVWQQSSIKFVSAHASCCGVARINSDLIGKEFGAGSRGDVTVTLDHETIGPWEYTVFLDTEPPSPQPISLTVRMVVADVPRPSQKILTIERVAAGVPSTELAVSYIRDSHEVPLEFLKADSKTGRFSVQMLRNDTEKLPYAKNRVDSVVVDRIRFQIVAQHMEIGEIETDELELQWASGVPSTSVKVVAKCLHPISIVPSQLFFGEVSTGEKCTLSAAVRARDSSPIKIDRIDSRDPFVSGENNGETMTVRVTAPPAVGRFESQLRVNFADREIPPISVGVSGIVVSPQGNNKPTGALR